MANTIVYRTTVAEGNRQKWTFSCWLKYNPTGQGGSSYQRILDAGVDTDYLRFTETTGVLLWYSGTYYITTERVFRDPTAWYHIVLRVDTTAASGESSADRYRLYVNGVRDELSTSSYPPSAYEGAMNNTGIDMVLGGAATDDQNFNGSMSHIHMCDGYSYAPTEFGETDTTSGIWKIKTGPAVSYGTNGFFLKGEDRSNLDLDSGTNAFTFTTSTSGSGALTATYDNPSNNFATMNPLDNYFQGATFSNGNNKMVMSTTNYAWVTGTMPLFAGLWYFETYVDVSIDTDDYLLIGAASSTAGATNAELGTNAAWSQSIGYYGYTGGYRRGGSNTAYGDTFGDGNYIGTYIDLDAEKIYWSKDGVLQNSGTGVSLAAIADTPFSWWLPSVSQYGSGATYSVNFGNGYFGTTEITSPSADEGGIGAFKYDPSSGTFDGSSKDFRAICTKNIKLYGAP